jgi:hypothetical protein
MVVVALNLGAIDNAKAETPQPVIPAQAIALWDADCIRARLETFRATAIPARRAIGYNISIHSGSNYFFISAICPPEYAADRPTFFGANPSSNDGNNAINNDLARISAEDSCKPIGVRSTAAILNEFLSILSSNQCIRTVREATSIAQSVGSIRDLITLIGLDIQEIRAATEGQQGN